jgi:hypothetical protein
LVAPVKQKEQYRGFPILPIEEFLLSVTPENPLFA